MPAAIKVTPYQKRFITDTNRFRLWVASVQSGKSFAATLKHVLRRAERKGLSIFLSASDRQSVELMEKVKTHAAAMKVALESASGFFAETSIQQHTATFPNGSRIIALPANPDTARGYSGDVVLDEFAMHRDSRKIWAALFGRATRGYDIDVLSTFQGTDNKFYELAKLLGLHEGIRPAIQPVFVDPWSGHWTDIHLAREEGLKVNIDQLRAALADDEVFLQEYCCLPMSSAEEFIPLDLVLGCESDAATIAWDGESRPDLFAGMDIGRKRDLTVIWLLERAGDLTLTRGVITLDRLPFADQLARAREVARAVERFSIDAGGIGAMLAEELAREFPGIVEPVQFTGPIKERLAVETKRRIEDRSVSIPQSPKIRRAIQSVKRYVGPTGQMRFDAAHTDAGHADEFWALALALAAASTQPYHPLTDGALLGSTILGNLLEARL